LVGGLALALSATNTAAAQLPAGDTAPVAPGAETPATTPPAADADDVAPGEGEAEPPATTEGGVEVEPTEAGPAEAAPESDDGVVTATGSGLFEQSLSAAPPASEAGADVPVAESLRYDLNGFVRGDVFAGPSSSSDSGLIKAAYGELALQLRVKKERYGDAYAEARLRYGLQGEERALFVDLREAYVNAYVGPVDFRLGHQIIVWGRADAFNPTNNLTPVDLRVRSPVEDDRRVGNVGARTFLNFAPVRIEGVWMPLYAATEFPPIEPGEFITLVEDFPAPKLENGLGAGRVHLELPAFEMSASYLYGHAPLPGLSRFGYTIGVSPPEIFIARRAYDHHVVGFDFSTAISDVFALRGEAAYRHPLDYEDRVHAPRPDLQYVVGIDRAFGSVSVILQYMGRYVFDWQREDGPDDPLEPTALSDITTLSPAVEGFINAGIDAELAARNQVLFSQTERIQHLASARIEWLTLHDTLSLSALGMLNFTTEEWLVYPKLGYQLSDGMSAYVGAEIYVGPEGTLLDLIDEQLSAGYAELRFSY
jgi:hypothetical protein